MSVHQPIHMRRTGLEREAQGGRAPASGLSVVGPAKRCLPLLLAFWAMSQANASASEPYVLYDDFAYASTTFDRAKW